MKVELDISKYKYISFDIFDTLINRDVLKPTDIFLIVQNEYRKKYLEDGIRNFAKVRVESEKLARNRAESEVTLNDIYTFVAKQSNSDIAKQYMELELEIELNFSVPNHAGQSIYQEAIRQGKNIFITSDMYLPKCFIEELLVRNGYRDYKKLYLSSDVLKTKAQGDIFKLILENEKIEAAELLHIGDNYKSDVKNPRKFGIQSFYLKKKALKQIRGSKNTETLILESVLNAFLYNRNNYKNLFEQVGFTSFGPLLYGFVTWIKNELLQLQVDKVYFLSRDGHVMKRAFDLINDTHIKSMYIYASRKALQVPAIYVDSRYCEVLNSMYLPKRVNIEWFISKLGLEADKYADVIADCGFHLNDSFDGLHATSDEKVKALYERLLPDILVNSRQKYESCKQYMESHGCSGKIAIIDIGWFGNMQKALSKLFAYMNGSSKIYGYYLGVVPNSVNQTILNMRGYLFQKDKNRDIYQRGKDINTLLEMVFMAPHGSCIAYDKNKSEGVVLDDFEYENTETFKNISSLQNIALDFVCQFNRYSEYLCNDAVTYYANFLDTFCRPNDEDAKVFGDIQVKDGPMILSLAKPKSWKQYLSLSCNLLQDFCDSSWKIGFLKRLFKLNLRYDSILLTLRKVRGVIR